MIEQILIFLNKAELKNLIFLMSPSHLCLTHYRLPQLRKLKEIHTLKTKYSIVFQDGLGCNTKVKDRLKLKENAKPVLKPKRPLSYTNLLMVDKEFDHLQQVEIIQMINCHCRYKKGQMTNLLDKVWPSWCQPYSNRQWMLYWQG